MNKNILTITISACLLVVASLSNAGGDAANGETLAAPCAACHGPDGNSLAPSFPKIAGLGEKYLYKQLTDIQSKTRDILEMAGQLDAMSDQDLQDLAAYFASQPIQLSGASDQELMLNSGEMVSSLELGEEVYRAGNAATKVPACTGCHSPRGLGNEPAAYPRLSGQYADYIEKQLHAFKKGERANDGEARTMRSIAQHMSEAEIKAVASYIAGLN
jgi:cytochrome c553